ncbi:heme o synthase [Candidatus Contendibacter odensensis]|uniref:Protoheme IX farnesyltransferase n=1 Tax=Candidatus Contendobacter odensis Run_B_J11 TaxID=1400861 RepID=A0A7U7GBE0_9GAMM|nr:heme o synthase [Candidatus Contendobacter odensis]CDH44964.1 Protoheme IX farnesyltransferase [Candidatus Contendobacter odensis Run_B_J11]
MMTATMQTLHDRFRRRWRDYLELTKPKVVALITFTAIVGMLLATPGMVPWEILLFGSLGIALMAGSAAAINHLVDQRVDALMARTCRRPLPSGHLETGQVLGFALVIGGLGFVLLLTFTNPLTAILTFTALIGYAVVYTLFLKRATPQNIVIGGAAGAAPPLLGWIAVTGHIDPGALLLFLIIYVWTPPHFWALAIHRRHDYANANIPMLPVTHGVAFTRLHILLYTILLFLITLLPFLTGMSGWIYLIGAVGLGLRFLSYATRLYATGDDRLAMPAFSFSIVYLFGLFAALMLDHYTSGPLAYLWHRMS